MDNEKRCDPISEGVATPDLSYAPNERSTFPVAFVPMVAMTVAACGGGGGSPTGGADTRYDTPTTAQPAVMAAPPPPPPTMTQAGRFLAQSAMGSSEDDLQAVVAQGFESWLGSQLNMPRPTTFWDWLVTNGYTAKVNMFRFDGFDPMMWSQAITAPDQLRQRVGNALLEILVVGINGVHNRWPQFGMAAYMDILWNNAFGNYRTLLDQIALSPVMAWYLSFAGSKKANAAGARPDENFAREIMQLFTIGLNQLNMDGTLKLANGKPIETYTLADVSGLARVFTGWILDGNTNTVPDLLRAQMSLNVNDHELGAKTFLGKTIPAGIDGKASLKIALDTLFAHPNVPPFISKQLIQRLVTANPSPAYVQRVAQVFANNGSGVRGDLKAVVRTILLDPEARNDAAAGASTTFGKLREPLLRFTSWARAFKATSPSNTWPIGDTSSVAERLGQGIGRSPSVFNFFRPGYSPPNSAINSQKLVAPEFQITNEMSTVSYINFMIVSMRNGWGDFKADFTEYLAVAKDPQALLDLINVRVAGNQVSAATIAQIKTAVDSVPETDLQGRVNIATTLIMASPEYLVLK